MRIAVVIGSTRPGRKGEAVGRWVKEQATARVEAGEAAEGVTYELVDLADFDLPLLCEPTVPGAANGEYENERTTAWSECIAAFDGYVFVTAEYNHSIPAAFKNAFDVLFVEWRHKAVGFVGYGAENGVRAVEHWRAVVANASMLQARNQAGLDVSSSVAEDGTVTAPDQAATKLRVLFGELEELTALAASRRA
ncbi:NADPH-dependent FMN reductase [Kytococcus sp. Marseille-QA3725]